MVIHYRLLLFCVNTALFFFFLGAEFYNHQLLHLPDQ